MSDSAPATIEAETDRVVAPFGADGPLGHAVADVVARARASKARIAAELPTRVQRRA